jgi:hypothetical protein
MKTLPSPWSKGWEGIEDLDWFGQRNELHHDFASQAVAYTKRDEARSNRHGRECEFLSQDRVLNTQIGLWHLLCRTSPLGSFYEELAIRFLEASHPSRPLLVDGLRRIATFLDHQMSFP